MQMIKRALFVSMLTFLPIAAIAQHDDHGAELQVYQQQAIEALPDLSIDPRWKVHAFEDRGTLHFHVIHLDDHSHLVVSRTMEGVWSAFAGSRATSVSLPGAQIQIPKDANVSIVHSGPALLLVHFDLPTGAIWSVQPGESLP